MTVWLSITSGIFSLGKQYGVVSVAGLLWAFSAAETGMTALSCFAGLRLVVVVAAVWNCSSSPDDDNTTTGQLACSGHGDCVARQYQAGHVALLFRKTNLSPPAQKNEPLTCVFVC